MSLAKAGNMTRKKVLISRVFVELNPHLARKRLFAQLEITVSQPTQSSRVKWEERNELEGTDCLFHRNSVNEI